MKQPGGLLTVYRILLVVTTSRQLREQYGHEMVRVFTESIVAARNRGGKRETARVALMEFRQLLRLLPSERLQPRSIRSPGWLARRLSRVLESIGHEILLATRAIPRRLTYSLTVITVLAIGIGLNTAVTRIARASVAGPLPFPAASELFVLQGSVRTDEWNARTALTIRELQAFREHGTRLSDVSIFSAFGYVTLSSTADPVTRVPASFVSSNYFRMLGADPLLGRTFTAAGLRSAPPEVILSYANWEAQFDRSDSILGSTVTLTGRPFTVVGVMRPDFVDMSRPMATTDVWLPVRWSDQLLGADIFDSLDRAMFFGVGKLAPGSTVAAAEGELRAISAALFAPRPRPQNRSAGLTGLRRYFHGDAVKPFTIVFAGALVVLMVCCANVALMILSSHRSRRTELALRSALGASRVRLSRVLVVETLLLVVVGQVAGILLGYAGVYGYESVFGALRKVGSGFDFAALAVGGGVSIGVAVTCSIYPAWRCTASIDSPGVVHRHHSDWRAFRVAGWRVSLIVQAALATILVVGALLISKSLANVRSAPRGYVPQHLYTARLDLVGSRFHSYAGARSFARTIVPGLASLPGVQAAALLGPDMLGRGLTHVNVTRIDSDPADADAAYPSQLLSITPGAFEATGIELVKGRDITWADRRNAPLVAIVGEELAQQVWPGEDPIGQRFYLNRTQKYVVTVVGLAKRATHRGIFGTGVVHGDLYLPYLQYPTFRMSVMIRSTTDLALVTEGVQQRLTALDPDIPLFDAATMTDRLYHEADPVRIAVAITTVYAAIAAIVSVLGVMGVLLYSIQSFRSHIAIRCAIGGSHQRIALRYAVSTLLPSGAGVLLGLVLAAALAPLLGGLLYRVSPIDRQTYTFVASAGMILTIVVSYLPARFAVRVSPLEALRPKGSVAHAS